MRNLKSIPIGTILFLDIETVPQWKNLKDAPEHVQKEWIYKFKFRAEAPNPIDPENANENQKFMRDKYFSYFEKLWLKEAGLYAEFSKIICASFGFFDFEEFRIKSIRDENESNLVSGIIELINSFTEVNRSARLCAHFGQGFDYPFMAKRMLIHRKPIPAILDKYGVKPWEDGNLDTHEIWRVTSRGASATLSSIAMAFGIPSPKDDIGGAEVASCYYNGEIDRIVVYCEKDVITLANIFRCILGMETIQEKWIKKV